MWSVGMPNNTPQLSLVFFVIDWGKQRIVSQIFEKINAQFHWTLKGQGTASSDILDLLGIGSIDKAVMIALERDSVVKPLLKEVSKKLGLNNPGAGIAWTVPLSSANLPLLSVFKEVMKKEIAEFDNSADSASKD
jgi:hypothetical protein